MEQKQPKHLPDDAGRKHRKSRAPAHPDTPARRLFGLLVLPLTLIYLEIMVRVMAPVRPVSGQLLGLLLTALAFGCLLDFFCCLLPSPRANSWICFALQEIATIWYIIAYYTYNAYKVFMPPSSIFSEAGNVVKGFGDTLVTIMTKGLPAILALHVPVILYLIFRKKVTLRSRRGPAMALVMLVLTFGFGLTGYCASTSSDFGKARYTTEYSYDNAVHAFGVLTALQIDTRYAIDGNPYETAMILTPVSDPSALIVVPTPVKKPDAVTPADVPVDPEISGEETSTSEPETNADPSETGEKKKHGGTGRAFEAIDPATGLPYVIDFGRNEMDIDWDSLIASTSDSTLKSLYQYVQSQTGSSKSKYTGKFKGYNLILITAEAFSKEVIDEERTPTLYRLAHNGIYFEDFYQPAWGGSTSTGEFSLLMGLVPGSTTAMMHSRLMNNYFTMGNQLQRLDYFSRAYHNGATTYYSRDKTHTNFGYSEFIAMQNGMQEGVQATWPESDLEMMQFTLPQYIDHEPFSVYYMTISGHCNYYFGSNAMAQKNRAVTENMDANVRIKAYYACQQELEYALEYLVTTLEEAGMADRTVIAMVADHYPYGLEKSTTWDNDRDYLVDLYGFKPNTNPNRDHSAGIIWCGAMEKWNEKITISEPCYSLDILPTLSNLFGVEYDSRLLTGRDVLSDEPALVIWPDFSWKTEYGYYNGPTGKFTAAEGYEVPDEYVSAMRTVVANKVSFAKGVQNYDLYRKLFGDDNIT